MNTVSQHAPSPLILCVEDEQELLRDIADELIEAGYTVLEAANGTEALALLQDKRPDLILCDVSMPGLDGYGVLQAVLAMGPTHADIPFVFLSALGDPRQVIEGKRLGADDYLVKPIDYDLLLTTVHARLRQIDRIRTAQHPHAPAIDADQLAKLFGLTPSEARVAMGLVQGLQLAQIAAEHTIARTTVAFHIRNIFQKTGTSRQAELVALLVRTALQSRVT